MYSRPGYEYSDDNIWEIKGSILSFALNSCDRCLLLEIHHPKYRKLFSEYATSLGLYPVSGYSRLFPMTEDSTLVYHYECREYSVYSKMEWDNRGYSQCEKCSEYNIGKIAYNLERYPDAEPDCVYGWRRRPGKNCLRIYRSSHLEESDHLLLK